MDTSTVYFMEGGTNERPDHNAIKHARGHLNHQNAQYEVLRVRTGLDGLFRLNSLVDQELFSTQLGLSWSSGGCMLSLGASKRGMESGNCSSPRDLS